MASHNLSLNRVQMESMDEAVLTFSRISWCSVQRSLDPVPARSLVGRHNSWLLLCSFSAQRYLGENWIVVGEWWQYFDAYSHTGGQAREVVRN